MFFGVPTIFLLLQHTPPAALQSIRYFFSAAAPLPIEVARHWQTTFGRVIHEGYGLTETTPFAAYNHHVKHKLGSVGTPIDQVEMKVVDLESGATVGPGTRGEIAIRGPNVMLGYWRDAEATAQVMRDGWFYTGDIGIVDEEGYYYIVDRVKDMINVSGLKVYPVEVEQVLYQHPAVAEAAVFGAPDSVTGERVVAHIVLKPDQDMNAGSVFAFCRDRIASFKIPAEVAFVESIPKNATGKVLRRVLREAKTS
jgi:long-chain acyl-CoA synthetase